LKIVYLLTFKPYTFFVRKRLLLLVIIGLGFYLSYNLVRGIWDSYQNAARLIESQKSLAGEREENSKLKDQLGLVSSPYFVEKEARDKLGLAKKGEVIIVTQTPEPKKDQDQDPYQGLSNQDAWWKIFFN
jgi:cell division protein FtsB